MQSFTETYPTPYPELNTVLTDLCRSVMAILGGHFLAGWLQGSFAMGDFDGESDVDFLVVTHDDIPEDLLAELQVMHGRIYDGSSHWAQRLEGSYIRLDVLRDFSAINNELWYLDNGSRRLKRSRHCNTLVARDTVREHGVVLAGPAPKSLMGPVPVDALRREIFDTMCHWDGTGLVDNPQRINSLWYQSFVVVAYCRMIHTMHTGKLASKRAGVRWAMEHLDGRWGGLIERAWAERPDAPRKCRLPVNPLELQITLEFLRYTIELGASVLARLDCP